jgi:hypothetical protein
MVSNIQSPIYTPIIGASELAFPCPINTDNGHGVGILTMDFNPAMMWLIGQEYIRALYKELRKLQRNEQLLLIISH